MDPTSTPSTYLLSVDHVDALDRLGDDPEIAAIMVVPAPEYVRRFIKARNEGSAWGFAVMDQGRLVGVSSIVRLDSVFVRLKNPFAAHRATLPDGVSYIEPNDPHWWKADYTTRSPRHTLAC